RAAPACPRRPFPVAAPASIRPPRAPHGNAVTPTPPRHACAPAPRPSRAASPRRARGPRLRSAPTARTRASGTEAPSSAAPGAVVKLLEHLVADAHHPRAGLVAALDDDHVGELLGQ